MNDLPESEATASPKASQGSAGGAGNGTVARTIALLRSVAEAEHPVTIAELAKSLELPRPTVHRLLRLVREDGMVSVDETRRRYSIGPEFFRVAALAMRKRDLNDIALPIMTEIVDRWGENCLLARYLPDQSAMMYTDEVPARHALRFSIPLNEPFPLEWGCSSRVILASLPEERIDEILSRSQPSPVGQLPLPPPEEFKRVLADVARRGWDTTNGEKIGDSKGVSAPVFGAGQEVVGSLSTSIPTVRFPYDQMEELVESIVSGAAKLSNLLGAR